MKKFLLLSVILLTATMAFAAGSGESGAESQELVVATVNNPDMVTMKELTPAFTEMTGITVQYIVLPENELRQKVTQDVAIGGGNYDIVTIGTYDTPFWAKNGWIVSLEPYFDAMTAEEKAQYDRDDVFELVQQGLSSAEGELHALPFYAEGSIVFYRKDLFEAAGLTMPHEPTWDQIYEFAKALHKPNEGQYGIVLRGLPGWGQNMGPFGTMINAFGARWYDMNWNPQFNTPEMRDAWEFYKTILVEAGEPGPTTVGFTEALALMSAGKAAMWYDASVAAGFLKSPDSQVNGKIGYALAPTAKKTNNSWFWSWALAIEAASKKKDAAFQFLTWATSKEYIEMVAEKKGWASAPPGTRKSLYNNPQYKAAADFAQITYDSMIGAQFETPTVDPVPYKGIQFISIPEFQGLGEKVAQELAAYLSGNKSLDDALAASQAAALEVAESGGYKK